MDTTIIITLVPSIIAIIISIIALVESGNNNKIVATTDIIKSITDAKDIFEKSYSSYKEKINNNIDNYIEKNNFIGINQVDEAIKIEFWNFINRIELGCYYYLKKYIYRKSFKALMNKMIESMKLDNTEEFKNYKREGFEYVLIVWEKWHKEKMKEVRLNGKKDTTCSS